MSRTGEGATRSDGGRPGVNLVGFLEADIGLGEVARKLEQALGHAGIPHAPIVYRRPPSGEGWDAPAISGEPIYDTNVVCLNADYLQQFADDAGSEFFAGRYTIGVWFWETSVLRPDDRRGELFVDEIWVASKYVRAAVSAAVNVPVHVVPLPIEEPSAPTLTREQLGLPEGYLFLYVFDFLSAERKNPVAVVDAFTKAFAAGEGPVLVLKSVHGQERKPHLLSLLLRAAADRSDIVIRDGRVPAGERDSYIAACDCYVSLHRSEGFGLTIAEAMAYAKPVVATGYSGNLEFMTKENGFLVSHRLTPIPANWWAYSPGAEWAEPDVEAAAACLRQVWEHPDEARTRGLRGRDDVLADFSLHRTAAFVTARLNDVRTSNLLHARASLSDARLPILEASRAVSAGRQNGLVEGGRWSPVGLLRRLLLRALWPYLEEHRRFQMSVLDALTALRRSVGEVEQRVAQLERSEGDHDAASEPEKGDEVAANRASHARRATRDPAS